jgi:hypothetical protein
MYARSLTLRFFSPWALAALVLFWTVDAWPRDGATLVALVTTDPSAELSHRVEEQLEALGFDVIVLNPPVTGSAGPTSLEQAARNVGAIAAIRIVPMAQSVQVWIADPVTGQAVFRETVPPSGQKPSDAAVALGAVELLRASLLELHPPEPPPPPKPTAPPLVCPPPPPPEKPRDASAGMTAGFGVDLGLVGRPSVSWEIAIWLRIHDRFGLRAIALLSESPANVSAAPNGSVSVGAQLYGGELAYDLTDPSSTWTPVVGLGIAGAAVTVRGESTSTPSGVNLYEISRPVAVPFGHVGASWAVIRDLRLRADMLGGFSTSPVDVCVAPSSTNPMQGAAGCILEGRWGEPVVNISLGLEVLLSR